MMHFSAVTDWGHKCQPTESREVADKWAADRCAEGRCVKVYCRRISTPGRSGLATKSVELVGRWEPLTAEEKARVARMTR